MSQPRTTRYRRALCCLFADSKKSYSLEELRMALKSMGLEPHRTTLFRELRQLLMTNVIEEIGMGNERTFKGRRQTSGHHHHAVCDSCHAVLTLDLPKVEAALAEAERILAVDASFISFGHQLSVIGKCAACQGESA